MSTFPSRLRRLWEPRLAMFVIFYMTCGAGTSLFFSSDEAMMQGRSTLRLFWLPIYFLILVLAAPYWRRILYALKRDPWMTGLTLLALLSALWSVDFGLTVRRGLALAMTTLFGLFLTVRFSQKDIMEILWKALALTLVLSVVLVIVTPDIATMYGGKWRGIHGHKNTFGRFLVLTLLVLFSLRTLDPTRKRLLFWLIPCGVCLVFSGSATAWLTAMILPAAWFALWAFRLNPVYAPIVPAVMLAAALVLLFVIQPLVESIFVGLGRDPTMTGRTDLWIEVMREISERPLLGHGYGAFWGDPTDLSMLVWDLIGWNAPHAHNGLLELGLDVGVVGALAFLVSYFRLFFRSLAELFQQQGQTVSYWAPLFLIFIAANNVSEVAVLSRHSSIWVLYLVLAYREPK